MSGILFSVTNTYKKNLDVKTRSEHKENQNQKLTRGASADRGAFHFGKVIKELSPVLSLWWGSKTFQLKAEDFTRYNLHAHI